MDFVSALILMMSQILHLQADIVQVNSVIIFECLCKGWNKNVDEIRARGKTTRKIDFSRIVLDYTAWGCDALRQI